jgi:hypothetical protein
MTGLVRDWHKVTQRIGPSLAGLALVCEQYFDNLLTGETSKFSRQQCLSLRSIEKEGVNMCSLLDVYLP